MKKCYQCGSSKVETVVIEEYHYKECGLDDVFIVGVKQHKCGACGETFTEFPQPKQLHRVIGEALCSKGNALSGKEVTFLRKEMRKNGKEFALMLSISAEHLSRIEHDQKKLSGSLDTLIKALYTIFACEGEMVSHGAMESVAGKKSGQEFFRKRIELTPSDWLMRGGRCCAVA